MKIRPVPQAVITLPLLTMVFLGLAGSAQATAGSQIVFSCTAATPVCNGTGTWCSATTLTPGCTLKDNHFGFWYWCQGPTTNAYGSDCQGSLYIYGITTATFAASCSSSSSLHCVTSVPIQGGVSYTLKAFTSNGWVCSLTNNTPVSSGPHNTVTMTCTTQQVGTGSGTANNANVIVQAT
jgi:hypothetical protein